MTGRGGIAYAHTRMLAWKSRLLTRVDAAPLFTASNATEMQRVLGALEIRDPLARLLRIYGMAIGGYPHGAELFRALLRLREIENVKLLWRLSAKPSRRDALEPLWIDLGELATVPRLEAVTPNALAGALRSTPYGSSASTAARVHGNGGQSVPLRTAAFDVVALRRERLRLCRRAFVSSPFLLAPALATVLLAEEEARAVRALVEREGHQSLDSAMVRALAASRIGA